MTLFNKVLFKVFGTRLVSSQTGEDLIIEMLLPEKKKGFYVDIGANHPIKFNNTFLFHNKGWRGINIEPNPSRMWLFKLLRRSDINLNIGVGREKSEIEFHVFRTNTLSTFDKTSSTAYQQMGHVLKKTTKIAVLPLSDIFEKYAQGEEIDLMSIDTEGFDMEVLKSNDWNKFRPRFIILETLEYRASQAGKKLNNLYDPYMEKIGYTKIADTYINTIYEKNT